METPIASSPWPSGTPDHDACLSRLRERIAEHEEALAPQLAARGLGPYRGYHEQLRAIERLVGDGVRLSQIGRSVRGEPLWALALGSAERERRVRTTVVLSGLHPNEWIGIETHLALLARLKGAQLEDRTIVSIPICNPDGIRRVDANLRTRRKRFVRHNARGVDLNRNFAAHWGHKNWLAQLVPWVFKSGAHAASEPEVAAIAHALSAHRIDRSLSLHSFGGVVLYPSGARIWPVADAEEHRNWARAIGRDASSRPYRALPSSWFGLGMTMGGLELDWFHQRHGALSLLVECSRGGIGLRPERLLNPFAWFNPPKVEAVSQRIAAACLPFARGDAVPT